MKVSLDCASAVLGIYLLSLLALPSARGDVRLPALFGDHMVLQQDSKLPVWGWAEAGEEVTVTLGQQSAKTKAAVDGTWRVDLKPVPSASQPATLTVAGKNTVKCEDVLVGEVWVCSGQSNMEMAMTGVNNAREEMQKANDAQLRFFIVEKNSTVSPQTDVKGKWLVCSPGTVAGFSGVAYFFGRDLRQVLQRPVGLIGTYYGGTPAQFWTSLSGLKKEPILQKYVEAAETNLANYAKASAEYPALKASYLDARKQWDEEIGKAYRESVKEWQAAMVKAQAEKTALPPRPLPSKPEPKPPADPSRVPASLFNGMVAPLIPYAIKGVIWYQGESNAGAPESTEYRVLFPRMITDWREKWGQGNFPFLFVQLANHQAPQKEPSEGGWGILRESQFKTLSLPNTGMASAIDVGDIMDIHPKDKLNVGLRLAKVARHVAYGEKLVYSGPLYESYKVEGNKGRVKFSQIGAGLAIGVAPSPEGLTPGSELTGFAVAGEDKKWVWAKAKIEGDSVVVWSDEVAAPVAVRYGWASNPPINLYNKEGLPASSFRTDEW